MPLSPSQSTQQTGDLQSQINESVLAASRAASALLTQEGKMHAVIGGQAVRLLGSSRSTKDVDILVDGLPLEIKARLVELDSRFSTDNSLNVLLFKADNNVCTAVELLRGGPGVSLALPSPIEAPKMVVKSVAILHPSILIITKIKRWVHIAESTRPQSINKARTDLSDIEYLLQWLDSHGLEVDFESYAAVKPKDRLLPAFCTLYRLKPTVRARLQRVLNATDFQYVSS